MNHSNLKGTEERGGLWRPFQRNNCGLYISIYTALTLSKLTSLSGNHRKKGGLRGLAIRMEEIRRKEGEHDTSFQDCVTGSCPEKERNVGMHMCMLTHTHTHTHTHTIFAQISAGSESLFTKWEKKRAWTCFSPLPREFGHQHFVEWFRILLPII